MKSLTLITKNRISSEMASQRIIQSFPFSREIVQNDSTSLYIGKFPNNISIDYDESSSLEEIKDLFTEKEISQIPFENPQVCFLNYHKALIASYPVEEILNIYPELIICEEDEDWIGTADEFIKKYRK